MKKLMLPLYTLCAAVLLTAGAAAYLDPTVTTYAIQAVAGIVIAAGAVVGVLWRKARKKAQQVLNIDENAHKEVEADVVAFDDSAEPEQTKKEN